MQSPVAEKPETAFVEAYQLSPAAMKTAPQLQIPLKPTVLLSGQVSFTSILDLTDARVMQKLGTTRAELGAKWRLRAARGREVPTWNLGRAIMSAGDLPGFATNPHCGAASFVWRPFPTASKARISFRSSIRRATSSSEPRSKSINHHSKS